MRESTGLRHSESWDNRYEADKTQEAAAIQKAGYGTTGNTF